MPNRSPTQPLARPSKAGARTISRQTDASILPAEVFVTLFRQAIESGVAVLSEAGVDEADIWANYRTALNVIVQTTLDVDTEKHAIAA